MYNTCAAPGINGRLIDAIRAHGTTNPGRTAYVVAKSELHEQLERTDEKFVVVALPDISAGDIDRTAQQVRIEVRACPDGTRVECVVLANGAVAITGQAVAAARIEEHGRLLVAWLFGDNIENIELSEYFLSAEDMGDLQAASQIAQSHAHLALPEAEEFTAAKDDVIEVFQYVSVAVGHPK